jgi:hypothetical protein
MNAPIVEEEAAGGKKSVMFGWCMDGNDEECIKEFPGHRCSCECHSGAAPDGSIIEEDSNI